MSPAAAEELLAEARRLEAEAIGVGEDGLRGRALRGQAASLRVSALGERPYPVLVCSSCLRLTGWRDAAGSCDPCARHAARLAAEAASAGWLAPPEPGGYPQATPAPPPPLAARVAARLGRGDALARALAQSWMARVEPGDTGPIAPEPGFELEAATRDELERIDGAGVLVRFATATHRFGGGGWERLPTTRIARSVLPNPAEFPAELAIETLVEAWGDYQQAVARFNRDAWSREGEAREAARVAAAAHDEALREQGHTSELLHE